MFRSAVSSVGNLASRSWRGYANLLQTRPIATNMVTSCVVGSVGDIIAQRLTLAFHAKDSTSPDCSNDSLVTNSATSLNQKSDSEVLVQSIMNPPSVSALFLGPAPSSPTLLTIADDLVNKAVVSPATESIPPSPMLTPTNSSSSTTPPPSSSQTPTPSQPPTPTPTPSTDWDMIRTAKLGLWSFLTGGPIAMWFRYLDTTPIDKYHSIMKTIAPQSYAACVQPPLTSTVPTPTPTLPTTTSSLPSSVSTAPAPPLRSLRLTGIHYFGSVLTKTLLHQICAVPIINTMYFGWITFSTTGIDHYRATQTYLLKHPLSSHPSVSSSSLIPHMPLVAASTSSSPSSPAITTTATTTTTTDNTLTHNPSPSSSSSSSSVSSPAPPPVLPSLEDVLSLWAYKTRTDAVNVSIQSFYILGPPQIFNQYFVPPHFRALFQACLVVGWSAYLSIVAHKGKTDLEDLVS